MPVGKPKGYKKTGGRAKGVVNKSTKDMKAAFQKLVENNEKKFQKWIDTIAVTDPAKAMDLMVKMAEYFMPKLQRTETKIEVEDRDIQVTRKLITGDNA